ncbi:MAG: two-component system sensor histidine kinase CreC [Candidatus Competibacteraceae bacterium]|nr:two-component system sensor histidine kinase CreC [Candidatus Competibacteraceae bacterium]
MKIRTRLFLVFVLLVVLGFTALVRWIADDLRPRYLESLEEGLVDTANILAEVVATDMAAGRFDPQTLQQTFTGIYQRRFHARIYALDKFDVEVRVYLTDAQGVVIFDSTGRDVGADYSRWNDVARTLQGEYGARSTQEDPSQPSVSVLYIAAPIYVGGELQGVLSVGKPAYNAERFLAVVKQNLISAALVAGLGVLVLGLGLYVWISWPLERLSHYARAVQAGERVKLPHLGRNEIGAAGAAIEAMRQALAGKDYAQRYVQTLTHELKSPLAAIRGAAELLNEDMPLQQRQRFMANIRHETQRIQELVDRMLELAAVEKRQTLEQVEQIDLAELAQDAIRSLETQLQRHDITAYNSIATGLTVRGERFLLRQALLNLLQNAVAFSPAGTTVTLSAAREHSHLCLRVDDQGSGVPAYALAKVFERFYSLPRPDGSGKSTGLGLSFVREVAELHNGSVQLINKPKGGTTAELRLPVA